MKVSIVGASGYIGGEALRILLQHPKVELQQVTSESNVGKPVFKVHPNLRKQTDLKFSSIKDLHECDVLLTALPHGMTQHKIKEFIQIGTKIIDKSSDFRLHDKEDYPKWYGEKHSSPEFLEKFVYGLPELHSEEIKKANYVASPGCLATTSILGLYPLVKEGLVKLDNIVIDAKIGSSASGNKPSLASNHAERSRTVRSFQPSMHRHIAEIEQELDLRGKHKISFSPHAIELVRGILATSHAFLEKDLKDLDVWKAFRKHYGESTFIRLVKEKEGIYRYPEPKILQGTNYCDIGFELDGHANRIIVMSALDNLMKGGAGQAIQCMNLMSGFPEKTGLEFPGLHPI